MFFRKLEGTLGSRGLGVNGELLARKSAARDKLIHKIIDRLHDSETEACNKVTHLACDRHHLGGAESVTVHDKGLHDLRHGFAFTAVEDFFLFGSKVHFVIHVYPPFNKFFSGSARSPHM